MNTIADMIADDVRHGADLESYVLEPHEAVDYIDEQAP